MKMTENIYIYIYIYQNHPTNALNFLKTNLVKETIMHVMEVYNRRNGKERNT
jgi:hypothetical protein